MLTNAHMDTDSYREWQNNPHVDGGRYQEEEEEGESRTNLTGHDYSVILLRIECQLFLKIEQYESLKKYI